MLTPGQEMTMECHSLDPSSSSNTSHFPGVLTTDLCVVQGISILSTQSSAGRSRGTPSCHYDCRSLRQYLCAMATCPLEPSPQPQDTERKVGKCSLWRSEGSQQIPVLSELWEVLCFRNSRSEAGFADHCYSLFAILLGLRKLLFSFQLALRYFPKLKT